MPGEPPNQAYSREQVRRLLGLSERRLKSWEKQNLIPPSRVYTFSDLLALRTLEKLRQDRVPTVRIRRALLALREKLRHVRDPIKELKIFSDGKKIAVHIGGGKMEAISGQLLLDFDREELSRLLSFPGKPEAEAGEQLTPARSKQAELWFQKGLALEAGGAPAQDVIQAYLQAVLLDGRSAGALINLGTIYFHSRAWPEAELYYRKALEIDPNYALAHFNMGNLFDEMGDRAQAQLHYETALRLNPDYADAHYNLALLHQTSGQVMNAVGHWKAYLKLDRSSSWAAIARREMEKLRQAAVVEGAKASRRESNLGNST